MDIRKLGHKNRDRNYLKYRVSHSLPKPALNILQRNLNRSAFVVWEMKRNVSVVRLIVATRSSGPPASGKIIKEMPDSVASWTPYIFGRSIFTCY